MVQDKRADIAEQWDAENPPMTAQLTMRDITTLVAALQLWQRMECDSSRHLRHMALGSPAVLLELLGIHDEKATIDLRARLLKMATDVNTAAAEARARKEAGMGPDA